MEKTELIQLLEFQRMRIDNLEREYDQLLMSKQEYPKSGVIDMANSGALFEMQDKLEHSELRCKILQEQVDSLTMNFAKQIAQLKARMTEQGAQLLINAELGQSLPPSASPSLHHSGVLKKKIASNGSSTRLDPIDNLRQSQTIQNESPVYEQPYGSRSQQRNNGLTVPQGFMQQFNSYGNSNQQNYYQRQIPQGNQSFSGAQSNTIQTSSQRQQSVPTQQAAMNQFYAQFQLK